MVIDIPGFMENGRLLIEEDIFCLADILEDGVVNQVCGIGRCVNTVILRNRSLIFGVNGKVTEE